jgi:DNA-binding transcriptional MerR regulator
MTIGRLAERTGVTVKRLRDYERWGLVCTLGRSAGNYRLFDERALWCVRQVQAARALGLTLREIRELGDQCRRHPEAPLAPLVARLADRALARVEARLAELAALRRRLLAYRAARAVGPAGGEADVSRGAADPWGAGPAPAAGGGAPGGAPPLDSPPGGRA